MLVTLEESSKLSEENRFGRLRMKINRRLLPIKAHFFFFMAASGPILPFLTVYGKQLGVSEVLMGSITAVVPLTFLLAKPAFGFIADYFYQQRKLIFMGLVCSVAAFYLGLYFVPPVNIELQQFKAEVNQSGVCNQLENATVKCNVTCSSGCRIEGVETASGFCYRLDGGGCNETDFTSTCRDDCFLQIADGSRLLRSFEFYGFIFLMTLSMIAFNVSNSISDAICFDVLGEGGEKKYGYQRVWGAVGFGLTAFLGGLGMDFWAEGDVKNYAPAFALVLAFTFVDLFCCSKLQLPKMSPSENIVKDLLKLLKNKVIFVFLTFATLIGILDGFLIFFMFWFLEDLAKSTGETKHIKVLEGLTVAAETLGGEVLFFILSGKILKKLGYGHSFTVCFFNYALRLGLISLIPNPWWILPVELLMQGPTYALCYTTIVAYASAISPPGTSATMQGIVAGMDDGFGFALGSLAGGFLYRAIGGRLAFQIFSLMAVFCCIAHLVLYKCFMSKSYNECTTNEYKVPGEAYQMIQNNAIKGPSKSYGVVSVKP